MLRAWLVFVLLLGVSGCNKKGEQADKDEGPKPVTTTETGKRDPAGARTVEIEAGGKGFVPERIEGKPGEKLKLVFTRRAAGGDCMAQLKKPDGNVVELPLDKPYEVEVTVPADGEVKFACGMEMFFGVIVADKG